MSSIIKPNQISNYIIIKEMGKGAYSTVFLIKHKQTDELYAMKSVKLSNLSSKERENAINEIKILSSISNPNIIGYKESFYDDMHQTLNLVMEYAEEGDLEGKIKKHILKKTFFEEKEIIKYIFQITSALKVLHDNKIMHRDIKTANIFIKNGNTKLGDMNVSKEVMSGMLYTQIGTPYYASPEVWNDKPYEYKSDIWSMGCVLYEICTLLPPFRGKNLDILYKSVMKGEFDPIPKFYSKGLSNIVSSMLKVNSKERPTCEMILNSKYIKGEEEKVHRCLPFKFYTNGNSNIKSKKEERIVCETNQKSRNVNVAIVQKANSYRLSSLHNENSYLLNNSKNGNNVNSSYLSKGLNRQDTYQSSRRLVSNDRLSSIDDKIKQIERKFREESIKNKEVIKRLSSARQSSSLLKKSIDNKQSHIPPEANKYELLSRNKYNISSIGSIGSVNDIRNIGKIGNISNNKSYIKPNPLFSNRDLTPFINKLNINSKTNQTKHDQANKMNIFNIYETYDNVKSNKAKQIHVNKQEENDLKWKISPMKVLPSRIYIKK